MFPLTNVICVSNDVPFLIVFFQITLLIVCAVGVACGARLDVSVGDRVGLLPRRFNGRPQMPTLLLQQQNVWTFLAVNVLNVSHFCMSNMMSTMDIVTNCLVAVPTPVELLVRLLKRSNNDTMLEASDVCFQLPVYEFCRHCPEVGKKLWSNMTSIVTMNISAGDVCYFMTCNSVDIGKCAQLRLEGTRKLTSDQKKLCQSRSDDTCFLVNNSMSCAHLVSVASHIRHVKLPSGWLFSCGNISFTYIPANITGGPCALTRLGFLLFPTDHTDHFRVRRDSISLSADCDSDIILLSRSEYIGLAASLVGIPALAIYNTRIINKLACLVVKDINNTSVALTELLLDVQGVRKAALQNRAAIDYLLLKHNRGCNDFDGMCCFNLSDHSVSIHSHIDILHKLVQEVKQDVDKGWWDWIFGWLPDFGQLRYILGIILVIICILLLLCCCVPHILSCFRPRVAAFQIMGYD